MPAEQPGDPSGGCEQDPHQRSALRERSGVACRTPQAGHRAAPQLKIARCAASTGYPKDWKLRSQFVRFYRAGNKCEWCGAANRHPHPVTGRMVTLTTAHVYDKRPCNCKLLNLAALCNRCHFGWDRPRKLAPERLWKLQGYTRKTKRGTCLTSKGEAAIGTLYYGRKVRYDAR